MKFHRTVLGVFATIALIAVVTGCGKSSSATDPAAALDSTPPPAVAGINMLANPMTGKITITWQPSAAPDLANYEVYTAEPAQGGGNNYVLVGSTTDVRYELNDGSASAYAIRAVDISGNRSPYALYTPGEVSEDL